MVLGLFLHYRRYRLSKKYYIEIGFEVCQKNIMKLGTLCGFVVADLVCVKY